MVHQEENRGLFRYRLFVWMVLGRASSLRVSGMDLLVEWFDELRMKG